jgi:hypothetical protein
MNRAWPATIARAGSAENRRPLFGVAVERDVDHFLGGMHPAPLGARQLSSDRRPDQPGKTEHDHRQQRNPKAEPQRKKLMHDIESSAAARGSVYQTTPPERTRQKMR